MKRRQVIATLGIALPAPAIARAQPSEKAHRVGVLVDGSPPHPIAEALPKDLAGLGYVNGRNVTGVTNMAAELGGRRLQLLKDLVLNLRRVAVLVSTQDTFTGPFLHYMQQMAPAAGLVVEPVQVASVE